MFRTLALTGALAAALAGSALAQPRPHDFPRGGPPPGADRGAPGAALPTPDFIRAAAQTDEYERMAGRLASRMGKNPRVRQFGSMMIRDHMRTTAGLQRAIRRSGMPVPPPPPLRPDQRRMLSDLRGAGRGFDRAYIDQQVMVHQEALGVMQAYASGGSERALREAAAMTAPVVQMHLDMATQIQSRMR